MNASRGRAGLILFCLCLCTAAWGIGGAEAVSTYMRGFYYPAHGAAHPAFVNCCFLPIIENEFLLNLYPHVNIAAAARGAGPIRIAALELRIGGASQNAAFNPLPNQEDSPLGSAACLGEAVADSIDIIPNRVGGNAHFFGDHFVGFPGGHEFQYGFLLIR